MRVEGFTVVGSVVYERRWLRSQAANFLRHNLEFKEETILMFTPEDEGYVKMSVCLRRIQRVSLRQWLVTIARAVFR